MQIKDWLTTAWAPGSFYNEVENVVEGHSTHTARLPVLTIFWWRCRLFNDYEDLTRSIFKSGGSLRISAPELEDAVNRPVDGLNIICMQKFV